MMAESSLAALQSWLIFLFGTVLPIAFTQVGRWLYDWQGLATGLLALVAAWLWGNRILRAVRSEEPLRNGRPDLRAYRAYRRVATATSNSWGENTERSLSNSWGGNTERSLSEFSDELETLRRLIRSTLAGLPHAAIPLTIEHQAQCERIAKFKFRERRFEGRAAERSQYEELLARLSNLDVVRKEGSCRSLWEALTGINNIARGLLSEIRKSDQSSQTGVN